mgnify:CR=1 FL=1
MMRDNRIMRTDRPGGNIRLFLCKMKKKKKEVENMKSKYRFRRILSGVMAAVTIFSTADGVCFGRAESGGTASV